MLYYYMILYCTVCIWQKHIIRRPIVSGRLELSPCFEYYVLPFSLFFFLPLFLSSFLPIPWEGVSHPPWRPSWPPARWIISQSNVLGNFCFRCQFLSMFDDMLVTFWPPNSKSGTPNNPKWLPKSIQYGLLSENHEISSESKVPKPWKPCSRVGAVPRTQIG